MHNYYVLVVGGEVGGVKLYDQTEQRVAVLQLELLAWPFITINK